MNYILILYVLIVIVLTLYIYKQNNVKEKFDECLFDATGNTLFECKELCLKDPNCTTNKDKCKNICENCTNNECVWNYSKIHYNSNLIPNKSIIRGFSGNNFIKVTWMMPISNSEIIKYYIIVTTPDRSIHIYSYYDNKELPEYIIKNLDNNITYKIAVISKNKSGISDISNIITIRPNEHSKLYSSDIQDSYDNSLQNIVNNKYDEQNINIQKSIYQKQVIINELKDILFDKLKIKNPIGVYNVNIY